MFSKTKYVLSNINRNKLGLRNFQFKNFSTKEVMAEMNLSKKEVKDLSHLIRESWVKPGKEKLVGSWFLLMSGIVVAILGLGGYVRLNKAGLSMVNWDLSRIKAPSTTEDWEVEFQKYKNHPQYVNDNPNMTLEEFKWIFNLEHWHRQLGKSLGIAFLLPFLVFMKAGIIRKKAILSSLAIFSIGGLQGVVGWWMVKSGLKENLGEEYVKPDVKVSHYRLAVHFSFALLIFSLLFKRGLFYISKPVILSSSLGYRSSADNVRKSVVFALHALWLTIAYGSFMAGLDAGKIINTFPRMGDIWYPTKEHFSNELITENFNLNYTGNPFIVHFTHRTLATATLGAMLLAFLSSIGKGGVHKAAIRGFALILGTTTLQYLIGWFAVVNSVPQLTALLHQVWGVVTVSSFILALHLSRKVSKQEIIIVFKYLQNKNPTEFKNYLKRIEIMDPKFYTKKIAPILKQENFFLDDVTKKL